MYPGSGKTAFNIPCTNETTENKTINRVIRQTA